MIPAFIADLENRKRRGEFEQENRLGAEIGDSYEMEFTDEEDDSDEPVLESKGASPPPPPSPMEEARAQIELERQRALLEQEALERQRAYEEAQRQAAIERLRAQHQQAYDAALNYGVQQVGARGFDTGLVDQYGLLDLYNTAIDNARMGIAPTDENPYASYGTRSAFNEALETAQGTYRGDLNRQLQEIAPDDFAYTLFADAADDLILQEILDQQRADALAIIDQAKARGQLNQVGYDRALAGLTQQAEAGMADLQDLGLGVLSGYRDQLNALRDDYATRIGTADFANPLTFDVFQNRLDQTTSDLNNRLRGDVFRAVGDQSFFDPSTIISSSGAIQGFYNPSSAQQNTGATRRAAGYDNPLLSALTEQEEQRGANTNTGVF